MKFVLGLTFMVTTVQGTTCTANLTDPSPQEPIRAEVRFVNIGSGCWVLSSTVGHRYEPMQLAEEFRREGLEVLVRFRHRGDVGSVCMLRDVIEILEIEAR